MKTSATQRIYEQATRQIRIAGRAGRNLWTDEAGAVFSMEICMVATILVIGMTVGMCAVRDAVVTEMADVGAAVASLSQSFEYAGVQGHHATTASGRFEDQMDFGDDAALAEVSASDPNSGNSRCVVIGAELFQEQGK